MARTALRRRLTWQTAAVTSVTRETASVVTIQLDPPAWPGHRAGQHLDVRLTAEDGYTAEREYSIASAPGEPPAITVERLEGGEVSPYLTGELRAGDELELRGPVGGYFVWEPGDGGPLMLLAGGSGIVPLRSILRHRHRTGSDVPARLLYSSRTLPDAIYRDELGQRHDGVQVSYTLTRGQPPGWTGHTGRINQALLRMSRRRSPCRRASRTRSPCPRAGRTKIPCDGGVGRTFTGSAGCGSYTPVSGQEGVRKLPKAPAASSSPRPQVPGGNLEPTRYRITVRGRLTKRLMSAFEGLDVEPDIEQTSLVAEIRDQSHLYGVLDLVRELGLDLVSAETNWVTPEPGDEESAM